MILLAARGLSKSYGGVGVLHGVDVDVRAGEIHALVGENGAGKSTLIKLLGGAVVPDAGEVRLEDALLSPGDPLAARERGISIVHQEFTLVPDLSVSDNIFLGREQGAWLRRAAMRRTVVELLDRLGLAIDPDARVRGLSVAHQQLVEIARALATDARVLILDEPTAALSGSEIDRLFAVLRQLRAAGLGILYISHRLDEVFALADRITVLRDGRLVTSVPAAGVTRAQLITWMVGRELAEEFPPRDPRPGDIVLDVRALSAPPRMAGATFSVRAGEIIGLAGLVGSGRTSTALAIAGALAAGGEVRVAGTPARFASPADAIRAGVAYVTEDRKAHGLIPAMSTGGNITLAALRLFTRGGLLSIAREQAGAAAAARRFDVRAASLLQPVSTLSGGNQQKVLLARATLGRPVLLILDEPTRGVDVGARAEIYGLMNQLTAEGLAILMISSDLPEVLGMSDRIVVMRDGRTVGELGRTDATPERVMALAAHAA